MRDFDTDQTQRSATVASELQRPSKLVGANMGLRLVDTPRAARLLGISPKTLEKYRVTGAGPSFVKLGRRVLYQEADLIKFIMSKTYRSTTQVTLDAEGGEENG